MSSGSVWNNTRDKAVARKHLTLPYERRYIPWVSLGKVPLVLEFPVSHVPEGTNEKPQVP